MLETQLKAAEEEAKAAKLSLAKMRDDFMEATVKVEKLTAEVNTLTQQLAASRANATKGWSQFKWTSRQLEAEKMRVDLTAKIEAEKRIVAELRVEKASLEAELAE